MVTIKLLKDYGDFKAGDLVDVKESDVAAIVAEAIGEKYVKPEPEFDMAAYAKEAVKEIVAEEKKDDDDGKKTLKIPAEPKDNKCPWETFGEFARAVRAKDQVLYNFEKATGLSEAIDSQGGFLIPPEFSTVLLDSINQAGALAPRAMNLPINHSINLPFVNNKSQATSWTGGVTIYKPGEGVAKTASKPEFGAAELKLHKMVGLVYVTDELLEDSPIALERLLTSMVSTEFALTKDEDMVNGSGAGEALGLLNAPCLITVAAISGQGAGTIVTENIVDMYSRLSTASMRNAIWLVNQDTIPQLLLLTISVGTGGAPVSLVHITDGVPLGMIGIPMERSLHCQTLGTKGDIILADFSQYVTVSKAGQGMKSDTSIHVKFVENETAFRFEIRFDGQPWWAQARTPKHGTNTVSPFIALNSSRT